MAARHGRYLRKGNSDEMALHSYAEGGDENDMEGKGQE